MHKRALVLGCGLVGATMARALADDPDFDAAVADASERSLSRVKDVPGLRTILVDLASGDAVRKLAGEYDIAIGAMPSALGMQTMRAVIEAGRPFCDISFFIEDPQQLAPLAVERGVTVVHDCGVAPGLANMAIGYAASQLDEVEDVVYYVGGLPRRRSWPFDYKAPFAPADVIEEYNRPARMIRDGKPLVLPALSEPELLEFPQVGTLEAFNTDGLRSLLTTVTARNMAEKTLRYPGHAELMRMLRETGFFSHEPVQAGGQPVRPLDVTSQLLFKAWRLEPGEPEFTLLRVSVKGLRGGRRETFDYELFDDTQSAGGAHSMARTTGYPCVIVAKMIAEGRFNRPGVHPPEVVGAAPGLFESVLHQLQTRGVNMRRL